MTMNNDPYTDLVPEMEPMVDARVVALILTGLAQHVADLAESLIDAIEAGPPTDDSDPFGFAADGLRFDEPDPNDECGDAGCPDAGWPHCHSAADDWQF